MTQLDVYDHFKAIFPWLVKNVHEWFPNGKNGIRIRMLDGREFIFTYNDSREWSFETVDMFLKRLT